MPRAAVPARSTCAGKPGSIYEKKSRSRGLGAILPFRGGARNPRLLRALLLPLLFLAIACAGQEDGLAGSQSDRAAERLFASSYADIRDIYIEEVAVGRLALAGLGRLQEIDPAVTIRREGALLRVDVNGQTVGAFSLPKEDDTESWGAVTAAVLESASARSLEIEAMDREALYTSVFRGMLQELDGFSRYAGAADARENRASRDGFGGIGIRIRVDEQGPEIVSVMEETPAARAGLKSGDRIRRIDGSETAHMDQDAVVNRLRGRVNSHVVLTVDRPSLPGMPLIMEIARGHIVPQTVVYRNEDSVAVIRISAFNQRTAETVAEKIVQAHRELGGALGGFVLDLRNNPGGLLDQAVAVSDLFISGGRILSTHGRHPDSHQYFEAEAEDMARGLPVVLLVNANSASAAEIVAAALQDARRGIVIGSSSYGKGTVQTVLRLPNQGELTLTWARFHAPSGYALDRRGVLPDICTSREGSDRIEAVLADLRSGAQPFDATLRRSVVSTEDEEGLATLRGLCPSQREEPDLDLEVALRLLKDDALYRLARGQRGPNLAASDPAPTAAPAQ